MPQPSIKRGAANRLAKFIRDSIKQLDINEKEYLAKALAKFFKQEDHTFNDEVFYNVATGTLDTDPAIKNPTGKNGR